MIAHGNVQDMWEVRDLWLGLCGCSCGWGHGTSARYVSQVAEEKQVWMDLKSSELTLKISLLGSALFSYVSMGSRSLSLGQGSQSSTGGDGGGALEQLGRSHRLFVLLSFICNQRLQEKT
ncbi:hypothetical protein DY000_02022065 [Brassica cretica]|uniref:Uncharacterized protein n=1 Tax=Brassica cretica TaxID=69181 RepID=A0ABQ7EE25_BRACR|nr:hypothetical protein DY000_02022065 [Brassica cretica]